MRRYDDSPYRWLAYVLVIPWIILAAYNKLKLSSTEEGRDRLLRLNPEFRSMIDARRVHGRPAGHLLVMR